MLKIERIKIILDSIERTAESPHPYHDTNDFTVYEDSGGNYDDAFALGYDAGWIGYAKALRDILNNASPD